MLGILFSERFLERGESNVVPFLKVVRSVLDGCSGRFDPSIDIVFNMESRERYCWITANSSGTHTRKAKRNFE